MEDIRTAINILEKDDYSCSVDLKDAYFLIPIDVDSRKYLRFVFDGTLFEFTCLPFGLCTSSYIYSKILRPVITMLRSNGIRVTNYLDDFVIFGKSQNDCQQNLHHVTEHLTRLGFLINLEKSQIIPDVACKYLGVIINSTEMKLYLTVEKKNKIKVLVERVLKKKACKFDELLSLIGILIAACPAVKWVGYFIKN